MHTDRHTWGLRFDACKNTNKPVNTAHITQIGGFGGELYLWMVLADEAAKVHDGRYTPFQMAMKLNNMGVQGALGGWFKVGRGMSRLGEDLRATATSSPYVATLGLSNLPSYSTPLLAVHLELGFRVNYRTR